MCKLHLCMETWSKRVSRKSVVIWAIYYCQQSVWWRKVTKNNAIITDWLMFLLLFLPDSNRRARDRHSCALTNQASFTSSRMQHVYLHICGAQLWEATEANVYTHMCKLHLWWKRLFKKLVLIEVTCYRQQSTWWRETKNNSNAIGAMERQSSTHAHQTKAPVVFCSHGRVWINSFAYMNKFFLPCFQVCCSLAVSLSYCLALLLSLAFPLPNGGVEWISVASSSWQWSNCA